MAVIVVAQDAPNRVVTANRNLTVTVTLAGVGFSVYFRINGGDEVKIRFGDTKSFDVLRNDVIDAVACGSGSITVTTA